MPLIESKRESGSRYYWTPQQSKNSIKGNDRPIKPLFPKWLVYFAILMVLGFMVGLGILIQSIV